MPDIDIDFEDRTKALAVIKHAKASRTDKGQLVPHNTGVYLHRVPVDATSGVCSLSHDQAEEHGYFKIDFLNVSVYKDVRDEAHLIQLMETEPLWDLLEQNDFTDLLFHVNGHGSLLRQMKPSSIEELAMCLALIRPAKRNLIGKTWTEIGQTIWEKPENGDYYFKKAHAIAYAHVVVVQMNLICEEISYGFS
jgi:DNA polymerase III alpha subunit